MAQQSLTDFVQTLVGGCLQTMQQRLQKEVTFRGKKLIAISLYSLFLFKLPSLPLTFLSSLSSPHPSPPHLSFSPPIFHVTPTPLPFLFSLLSLLSPNSLPSFLDLQACHLESGLLVRALDKLNGKLQAMDKLLPSAGLSM